MEALQESASKLGGVIPEDAITDIQRLTKGFEDFKVAFGEAFIENFLVAMPKAAKEYADFGRTVGQVTGSVAAAVILTAKFIELIVRTVILGVSLLVNSAIFSINALIHAINAVSGIVGLDKIGKIGTIDIKKQMDVGIGLTDDIKRIGEEIGKSFGEVGQAPTPTGTTGTTIQVNIENVNGLSAENVSEALSNELNSKVSL